ncbi:MAG: hypothetical protein AAFX39_10490 [Pseudomonadota bacterium]
MFDQQGDELKRLGFDRYHLTVLPKLSLGYLQLKGVERKYHERILPSGALPVMPVGRGVAGRLCP